jgi:hypothetical protein
MRTQWNRSHFGSANLAQGSVVEVISSSAELEIHEEKEFTHLDEEKERDTGTWVLDIEAMNHMSGCWEAFTKIEGRGTIMFVSKNGDSRSFDGVYFIPHLMTNIVSVGQLDEIGYKIDIDTGVMKI